MPPVGRSSVADRHQRASLTRPGPALADQPLRAASRNRPWSLTIRQPRANPPFMTRPPRSPRQVEGQACPSARSRARPATRTRGGLFECRYPIQKRAGVLAFAAALVFGACSSSGASTAPSAAASAAPSAAASTAASAAPSAAASTAASAPASPAASAAASMAAAPAIPTANVTLQGAGATFPAPLYDAWFETYTDANTNIQIDYQANGSGAGIKAITQQTVDFGASDAAMKDEEIAALPAGHEDPPHPDRPRRGRRHLQRARASTSSSSTRDNVAGIFLGTITKWNDPTIAANNPGVDAARQGDPRRPPLRRLGHDERLHDLPRHGQPGLALEGRRGQGSQVAGRHRRPGQRRRRRRRQADPGRGRLRRAPVRDPGQARPRPTSRTPTASSSPGSTDGVTAAAEAAAADFPADFAPGADHQRRGRRRPTRSPPTPTCSSTRTRPTPTRARPSSASSAGP